MMQVIKHVLKLVRPSSPAPAADVTAAREKLRCALEAARQAEQGLEDAKAHTERVLDVINGVAPLEAEATRAAEAAAEATRAWAISGASNDVPAGDQRLLDRAATAQSRLARARMMSTGAKAALPRLEQAERQASNAVGHAREQVAEAIASVMVATLSPHVAELREARAAYCQSLKEVAALARLWHPEMRHWHSCASSPHYEEITQQLRELEIRIPGNDKVSDRMGEWAKFAKRLTSDPDATLTESIEDTPHEL